MIGWPGSGSGPSSQPSKRPPSSEHSNSAGSVEENTNAADVLVVDAGGPETIVVSGRLPSTSQLHSSGVMSRTPNGRHRADLEDVLAVGQPGQRRTGWRTAANGPRSSAHSKVEPLTVEEKTKCRGARR